MARKVTLGPKKCSGNNASSGRERAKYSHLYPEMFDDAGRISPKITRGEKNE